MRGDRVPISYASWAWTDVSAGKLLPLTPEQIKEREDAAYWASRDVETEK